MKCHFILFSCVHYVYIEGDRTKNQTGHFDKIELKLKCNFIQFTGGQTRRLMLKRSFWRWWKIGDIDNDGDQKRLYG